MTSAAPDTDPSANKLQSRPLLSFVIPALVADVELRRCVDSVRVACADLQLCEIVVVLPAAELASARNWLPAERLVAERYPSIYGAMNEGANASRGQYLYFLGKDDIVMPAFGYVVGALDTDRPSALFFDVYWGTRGVYRGYPSPWRLLARNLCHQGIVYSREAYEKHGPYLRRMRVQADHLLNIRLLWDRSLSKRVMYVQRPLVWYSGSGFSAQHARDPLFWRLYPLTLRKYVGFWAACMLVTLRKVRVNITR
jgi:glycosyltransferase involved in cell wall biosynthesis